MSYPYVRVVLAAQDARTGDTVYQYGWAEAVTQEFDIERWPQHTTLVEWRGAFRTTNVYPNADDFPDAPAELPGARALPSARLEITS